MADGSHVLAIGHRANVVSGLYAICLLLDCGEAFTKQKGMSLGCRVHPGEEGTGRKRERKKQT
jgi:hypothetical protein